jgi:uncharacterized protein with beta-barrel porin domain
MGFWRRGAVIAAVMMTGAGSAQADFVIVDGQTVFLTQVLTFNQTGTIEPGGAILTLGDGVFAGGSNTINNRGRIATTGVGAFGITALNGNTISNSGSISTLGGGAFGITALSNNSIGNTGSISTLGAVAHGVQFLDVNTFTNGGTLSTLGGSAIGILGNDNNTIVNGGVVSTAGISAVGISVNDNNAVTNGGSISTIGGAAHGVLVNDNNTITNSGVISTRGLIAHGVQGNAGNTVINSGQINASGLGSAAVLFTGGGNTLYLLPGSVITGPLDFATGNTLHVANGLSIANTFTNNLPQAIETDGAPFAVNGLEVAVVDPTSLAMADDVFYDLTSSISGSVLSRLDGARQGVGAGQAVAALEADPWSIASSLGGNGGPEAWVQAFGLARDQGASSPAVGADHYLGGIVAGVDGQAAPDTRAGFFLGGSTGELDVKYDSQNEDIDSVFGGFYVGYATGPWAVDFVVTGGWSGYDLTRNVANNTAPGGAETVSADYDGYFIAPELAVSHATSINGHDIVPSVRLGYAGTHLDGYTETGSTGAMSVDGRDVQLLTGRFQVAVPVRIPAYADTIRFEPYVGVEGRTRLDDSGVDAVLLGQSISFDPGGEDTIGTALAGFELTARIGDGFYVFGRMEGGIESDNGRTVAGQAGLQITF